MQIGCLFPPTLQTPAHIRRAEELGYGRAHVYDSPAFLADPWMALARAAELTSSIALGVAVITPRLRHLVANAGAIATLHAITRRAVLLRELEEVRERGYAFDREEQMERICAIGVALSDSAGARASLTIATPAERFYGREDELVAAIVRSQSKIAAALGAPTALRPA